MISCDIDIIPVNITQSCR